MYHELIQAFHGDGIQTRYRYKCNDKQEVTDCDYFDNGSDEWRQVMNGRTIDLIQLACKPKQEAQPMYRIYNAIVNRTYCPKHHTWVEGDALFAKREEAEELLELACFGWETADQEHINIEKVQP